MSQECAWVREFPLLRDTSFVAGLASSWLPSPHVVTLPGYALWVSPMSLQLRREKISERMKVLQDMVPTCAKVSMLSFPPLATVLLGRCPRDGPFAVLRQELSLGMGLLRSSGKN